MQCQLARIIQPKDAALLLKRQLIGWYVWVIVGPPKSDTVMMRSVETSEIVDIRRPVHVAILNDRGDLIRTSLECLELLPYFDDVIPIHYKEWVASPVFQPRQKTPYL